jgi:hypothetical protein
VTLVVSTVPMAPVTVLPTTALPETSPDAMAGDVRNVRSSCVEFGSSRNVPSDL